jgi:hypothetical protein
MNARDAMMRGRNKPSAALPIRHLPKDSAAGRAFHDVPIKILKVKARRTILSMQQEDMLHSDGYFDALIV